MGDLPIVSHPEIKYGRFTGLSWVVQPLSFQDISGLPTGPRQFTHRSLQNSCDKSYGLLPVISQHVPSELSDPFGESPRRWQRRASQAEGDDDDKGGRWQHGAEEEMMTLVRVVAKEGDSGMGLYRQMATTMIEEEEL
ncbi:hypothetical protein B296_00007831 [Ensete ventricosum]|uniref:Uncharacterized protein n=1 Tax=Ensete ventricosum TaxID=4639 RepID=A0A427AJC9_ENSVE|nr:hypothetical protein B296_00007831 [Ensete ventricosum]